MNKSMETVIWVIFAIIYAATYEDFFSAFLKKKTKIAYFTIAVWGGYAIFQCTIMFLVNGYVMTYCFNFLSLFIAVSLLYRDKILLKLLAIVMSTALIAVAELITSLFMLINEGTFNANNQIYIVISKIVFWLIVRISVVVIKGKLEAERRKRYCLILMSVMAGNIFLVVLILELNKLVKIPQVYYWSLFVSCLMVVFDIATFKIWNQINERERIKHENEIFSKQLELCDRQMQERMVMMEEVRRTRHDMKNHIIYVQELLEKNKNNEAKTYIEEFMSSNLKDTFEAAQSGNLIIDSLINNKYAVAKSKGIRMTVDLSIPATLKYKASDLCIIVGNLLDNAIEASEQCDDEKREVTIQMKYIRDKIYIMVKNTYEGEREPDKQGNFVTTKKDVLNHGIGMNSINRIICQTANYNRVQQQIKIPSDTYQTARSCL